MISFYFGSRGMFWLWQRFLETVSLFTTSSLAQKFASAAVFVICSPHNFWTFRLCRRFSTTSIRRDLSQTYQKYPSKPVITLTPGFQQDQYFQHWKVLESLILWKVTKLPKLNHRINKLQCTNSVNERFSKVKFDFIVQSIKPLHPSIAQEDIGMWVLSKVSFFRGRLELK